MCRTRVGSEATAVTLCRSEQNRPHCCVYAWHRGLALWPAVPQPPPGILESHRVPGHVCVRLPCRQAPGPHLHWILLVLTSSSKSWQVPVCPCSPGFTSGLFSLLLAPTAYSDFRATPKGKGGSLPGTSPPAPFNTSLIPSNSTALAQSYGCVQDLLFYI